MLHDIISIDDTDHVRVGSGVDEGETQRARLEADDVVGAYELKALAERAAVLLDRQPQAGSGVLLITTMHS